MTKARRAMATVAAAYLSYPRQCFKPALVSTSTIYNGVSAQTGRGRPAFVFRFSDAPVMKALSLYRDETRS
jgi:gentisate 1,2-dioxygenase